MKNDPEEQVCEFEIPYDRDEVRRGIAILCAPASVHEVRALGVAGGGTVSGYFDADHRDELVEALTEISGDAEGVYITLNPVNPDLLARSVNRCRKYAKHTTSDADVVERRWLPLDFDPVRPAGISSTEQEHEAALAMAREVHKFLLTLGFSKQSLVLSDSGNGAHLLCRLELANDTDGRDLVKACIDAVAAQFSDAAVKVDQTTHNAARIWKVPGTQAHKGDHTADRPHRIARMLVIPKKIVPASLEQLRTLAALAPLPPEPVTRSNGGGTWAPFDLDAWLIKHKLSVQPPKPWNGGRLWVLDTCPWNPQHTNGAAYLLQLPNGAIAARCHHDSCQGKGWTQLRALHEPTERRRQPIALPAVLAGAPADIIKKFEAAVRN